MSRPVVLTFARYCLPGYKAGGPVRSLANLTSRLSDEFDFRVVCSDRDLGDDTPYPGLATDTWLDTGTMRLRYLAPESQGLHALRTLLRATPHDLLYLNSFFDPTFTALPLLARCLDDKGAPLLIAPRGEFSPGALGLKRWKKQLYLFALRHSGLISGAHWHASGEHEAQDIRHATGALPTHILVAPNLSVAPASTSVEPPKETAGPLRVLFLSRISPMKNLHFALTVLARVDARVHFTICGPVSDITYWQDCRVAMTDLPPHVSVDVRGTISPEEVSGEMARHDLFFLPTLGENYGHAIAEALCAGTPVLISDRTPWRDLARNGLGNDLPLSDEAAFVRAINDCARLSPGERAQRRERIRTATAELLGDAKIEQANRRMLLHALGARP